MKHIVIIIAAVFCTTLVYGKINETMLQCIDRYGLPISTDNRFLKAQEKNLNSKLFVFQHEGFRVHAGFKNEKVNHIEYFRYDPEKGSSDGARVSKITIAEKFMKLNGGLRKWIIQEEGFDEKSGLTWTTWVTEDGALLANIGGLKSGVTILDQIGRPNRFGAQQVREAREYEIDGIYLGMSKFNFLETFRNDKVKRLPDLMDEVNAIQIIRVYDSENTDCIDVVFLNNRVVAVYALYTQIRGQSFVAFLNRLVGLFGKADSNSKGLVDDRTAELKWTIVDVNFQLQLKSHHDRIIMSLINTGVLVEHTDLALLQAEEYEIQKLQEEIEVNAERILKEMLDPRNENIGERIAEAIEKSKRREARLAE